MAERTGWAPSDEMVEAAMQAEYEHDLAGMDHPTLAEFPRWTDWCDAEIHDALRNGMRAALAAVGPDIRAQAVRENEALTAALAEVAALRDDYRRSIDALASDGRDVSVAVAEAERRLSDILSRAEKEGGNRG